MIIARIQIEEAIKRMNLIEYTNENGKSFPILKNKIQYNPKAGKDVLIELFMNACEEIPEGANGMPSPQEAVLPDEIVLLYNALVDGEGVVVTKETVLSTSTNKNIFGHRIKSQSAKIDELLITGATLTYEEIVNKTGCQYARLSPYIKYLETDKGAVFLKTRTGDKKSIIHIKLESWPGK